jgi:hypothetical protein
VTKRPLNRSDHPIGWPATKPPREGLDDRGGDGGQRSVGAAFAETLVAGQGRLSRFRVRPSNGSSNSTFGSTMRPERPASLRCSGRDSKRKMRLSASRKKECFRIEPREADRAVASNCDEGIEHLLGYRDE